MKNLENFYGTMCATFLGLFIVFAYSYIEADKRLLEVTIKYNDKFMENEALKDSLSALQLNDSMYSIRFNKLVENYESGRR